MKRNRVIQMKDYNFFEIYEKKKGISINPKSVTFVGLVLLSIFILISFGAVGRNIYLDHKISVLAADTEVMKTSSKYLEAEKIQTNVDAMKEYDTYAQIALNKFKSVNTLGTSTLSKISSAIPAGVSLNSMTIDHIQTSFSFVVPDRKSAAELIVNLKDLDIFLDVHLVSVIPNTGGVMYAANVECLMKAGEKDE